MIIEDNFIFYLSEETLECSTDEEKEQWLEKCRCMLNEEQNDPDYEYLLATKKRLQDCLGIEE